MKRLLAVLGDNVATSLSPRLHEAAATACGLDIAYVPVVCADTGAFHRAIQGLEALGALGCNVTIPFKRAALERCDDRSVTAESIGVVNTITFNAGRGLKGENTDGPGLLRVLKRLPPTSLERVQILGSGGACRAAAWALSQLGADEVHVCARRQAEEVAALARGQAHPLQKVRGVTLVVSGLPGTAGLNQQIVDEWVDLSERPVVLDLAYAGQEQSTPLVQAARGKGLRATDGLAMLVEQAALSLQHWTQTDLSDLRGAMFQAVGLSKTGPLPAI